MPSTSPKIKATMFQFLIGRLKTLDPTDTTGQVACFNSL